MIPPVTTGRSVQPDHRDQGMGNQMGWMDSGANVRAGLSHRAPLSKAQPALARKNPVEAREILNQAAKNL